jgi:hypothetical protein
MRASAPEKFWWREGRGFQIRIVRLSSTIFRTIPLSDVLERKTALSVEARFRMKKKAHAVIALKRLKVVLF